MIVTFYIQAKVREKSSRFLKRFMIHALLEKKKICYKRKKIAHIFTNQKIAMIIIAIIIMINPKIIFIKSSLSRQ